MRKPRTRRTNTKTNWRAELQAMNERLPKQLALRDKILAQTEAFLARKRELEALAFEQICLSEKLTPFELEALLRARRCPSTMMTTMNLKLPDPRRFFKWMLLICALSVLLLAIVCAIPTPLQARAEGFSETAAQEETEEPVQQPTEEPTVQPTEQPTAEPTQQPTEVPTVEPTEQPTQAPTAPRHPRATTPNRSINLFTLLLRTLITSSCHQLIDCERDITVLQRNRLFNSVLLCRHIQRHYIISGWCIVQY